MISCYFDYLIKVAGKDVQAMGTNTNAVYKVCSQAQSRNKKPINPNKPKSNSSFKSCRKESKYVGTSSASNSSTSKSGTPKNPCSGCGKNHWKVIARLRKLFAIHLVVRDILSPCVVTLSLIGLILSLMEMCIFF